MKKKLYIILFIIISLYIFLNIMLYFDQKKMLYFPDKKDFFECSNFSELEKKKYKNTRFYEKKGNNNNVIIFFHGNAGSACNRMGLLNIFNKTDNNIIFVEYSGYSVENTNPNINDILKNVDEIGDYINKKEYEKIYVMGRSLGTGLASYYAGKFKTDKLLLVSPYSQLYKVAESKYPIFPVKLLFTENYDSENYLKNYKNDILIFHGKKDKVIPYKFGKELYEGLKINNKRFISKDNGTHHNIIQYKDIINEIISFF